MQHESNNTILFKISLGLKVQVPHCHSGLLVPSTLWLCHTLGHFIYRSQLSHQHIWVTRTIWLQFSPLHPDNAVTRALLAQYKLWHGTKARLSFTISTLYSQKRGRLGGLIFSQYTPLCFRISSFICYSSRIKSSASLPVWKSLNMWLRMMMV